MNGKEEEKKKKKHGKSFHVKKMADNDSAKWGEAEMVRDVEQGRSWRLGNAAYKSGLREGCAYICHTFSLTLSSPMRPLFST